MTATGSEGVIGGRIAAWVGAVLVMIGAGIFVKYAYEQGWMRLFGPAGRFIAATAGAIVLIVFGEAALRRISRAAALGLFVAGVGSLFVIAAAGTLPDVMKVYGPGGAALFALGAMVVGVVVARRSESPSLGVVTVIGAYLVPVFAGILRMDSALAAPSYVTAVLAMALLLAALVPGQAAARSVALALHVCVGLLILVQNAPSHVKQAFVMLWWGMFVLEAIVSSVRSLPGGDAEEAERPAMPTPAPPEAPSIGASATAAAPRPAARPRGRVAEPVAATIATLASTVASFAFAGAWAGWRDLWAWMPLVQAVLCVAAAAQLHAIRGERGRSASIDAMIPALVVLGAALAGCAAALLLQPRAASLAWAVTGGAAVIIAVRNHSTLLASLGTAAMIPACAVAGYLAYAARHLGTPTAPVTEVAIPGFHGARLVLAPNWWLPALVATVAFAAGILARPMGAVRTRTVLALVTVGAWGATAASVTGGDSWLLVVSLLPVAWFIHARVADDPLSRVMSILTGGWIILACLIIAVDGAAGTAGAASAPPGDATAVRAVALMVAVGAIMGAAAPLRPPALVAIAVALVFAGFAEVLGASGGVAAARHGGRAAGDVAVIAAFAALVAVAGSAIRRGGWWRTLALWAALVWLWGSVVLVLRDGLDDAPPMANLMNATAALVLAGLGVSLWSARQAIAACAVVVVVIVAGSWDLVRLSPRLATTAIDVATLRLALLSAWWALVAVAAVIAGFAWRLAPLRWMALSILAITAAKVLLVDLQRAATLARVGALLAVGLLMVVTSIVYARAERRLRTQPTPER